MIVRDGQSTLPVALSSLLLQTHTNWECIIVNDNSTDKTAELLDALTDRRFIVSHHEASLGRGQARSEALAKCRGAFVATLDADDFYFAHTLSAHVRALTERPDIVASVGPVLLFDDNEKFLGRLRRHPKPGTIRIPLGPHEIKLPFGSMVFRRELLEKFQYNATYNRSEDRDLYSRVLAGRQVTVLNTPTYAYRWNLSLHKVISGLEENEQIYASHFRESPVRTTFLVAINRLKLEAYKLLGFLGLWNYTNLLRIVPASQSEQLLFQADLRRVKSLTGDRAV